MKLRGAILRPVFVFFILNIFYDTFAIFFMDLSEIPFNFLSCTISDPMLLESVGYMIALDYILRIAL